MAFQLYFFPKRLSLNFHQKMINNLESVPNAGAPTKSKSSYTNFIVKSSFKPAKRA
ncbi:hypothetical protein LEP1GSC040_3968 [Leptospira santarosai str. 2000030832]|nr:hypothetical protein LEP1GSC040_3968 [Leptospira santarosai str. 2000030832]